jgi:hypothetical protein
MKLDSAMRIAAVCGLGTLGEAVYNIQRHAVSIFRYDEINDEISELIVEARELGSDEEWQEMLIPRYIIVEEDAKMMAFFEEEERRMGDAPAEVINIDFDNLITGV